MLFAVLCSLQELKGIKTYIFGCIKNNLENKKKKTNSCDCRANTNDFFVNFPINDSTGSAKYLFYMNIFSNYFFLFESTILLVNNGK